MGYCKNTIITFILNLQLNESIKIEDISATLYLFEDAVEESFFSEDNALTAGQLHTELRSHRCVDSLAVQVVRADHPAEPGSKGHDSQALIPMHSETEKAFNYPPLALLLCVLRMDAPQIFWVFLLKLITRFHFHEQIT